LSEEHGGAYTVRATTSSEEALDGASFVVSTVRAGGTAATKADLDVPARHGIEQGVADTVGPGGMLFAFRQIPALVDVAKTMERVCPDAWLLTFSNPMTAMCRAVMRASTTRCIGLCDGIFGRRKWVERYLGIPRDELDVRHAGINHMTWITELAQAGQDVYPALRRRDAGVGDQPVSFQLMDVFGLFPSPGDRHIAEFFRYFHRADADGGRQYGLPTSTERWETISSWRVGYEASFEAQARGDAPLPAPHPGAGEGTMELIAYLAGAARPAAAGKRGDQGDPLAGIFAANLPNTQGYVPGLQEWAIVEGFARADADGMHPLPPVELPPAILANLRARLDQIELTVEAALTGDRKVALQALAADPLVPSIEQATAILDEALAAEAPYLPQFR
jgi:alpha-galactosidase